MLELGMIPTTPSFADAALGAADDAASPLMLVFCTECALVQTLPGVPVHMTPDAERIECRRPDHHDDWLSRMPPRLLGPRSLVVEIGSGDGSLLRALAGAGITVLGVECSRGAAFSAAAAGVPTVTEPFDRDLATKLRAGGLDADVILASCVIDAIDGLDRFVEGLRILVADHGAIVVDTPYVFDLIDRVALSAVRHERRSYFSCTSFDALVRRHGLFLNDVELRADPVVSNLRCLVEPREALTDRCEEQLSAEHQRGVRVPSCYQQLQQQVTIVLDDLQNLLRAVRAGGHSVAASGAATDLVTLLNAGSVGRELLEFVVEHDALMQGMEIPGVRVPIVAPDALRHHRPDFLVVPQEPSECNPDPDVADFVSNGGQLIVLQPSPKILAAPC